MMPNSDLAAVFLELMIFQKLAKSGLIPLPHHMGQLPYTPFSVTL
jgi:hypothetical protein